MLNIFTQNVDFLYTVKTNELNSLKLATLL